MEGWHEEYLKGRCVAGLHMLADDRASTYEGSGRAAGCFEVSTSDTIFINGHMK